MYMGEVRNLMQEEENMFKEKKDLIWVLLIAMVFQLLPMLVFAAGSAEEQQSSKTETLDVYVSIMPQKYFVERIAGGLAEVHVMVPPGRSPATYEPTPKQVSSLGGADVFFTIGVPFEQSFLPRIRENVSNLWIVDTSEGIERREIQSTVEEADHEDDHDHDMLDPHIWVSPPLVEKQAENMLKALVELAPKREQELQENYRAFQTDLQELHEELKTILEPVKGSPLFVYHPSFGYFAETYGLHQLPIELGGNEPSPKQLQRVISLAKKRGVRVVFVQPEFSKASAQRVAEAINGAVVEVAPLKLDYLQNMRYIAQEVRQGLEGK